MKQIRSTYNTPIILFLNAGKNSEQKNPFHYFGIFFFGFLKMKNWGQQSQFVKQQKLTL